MSKAHGDYMISYNADIQTMMPNFNEGAVESLASKLVSEEFGISATVLVKNSSMGGGRTRVETFGGSTDRDTNAEVEDFLLSWWGDLDLSDFAE